MSDTIRVPLSILPNPSLEMGAALYLATVVGMRGGRVVIPSELIQGLPKAGALLLSVDDVTGAHILELEGG